MRRENLERLKKIVLNGITVSKEKTPDFDKNPFFIKKKEDAIAFIKKHGMPSWYKHKIK